jgi:hypothetical protein
MTAFRELIQNEGQAAKLIEGSFVFGSTYEQWKA